MTPPSEHPATPDLRRQRRRWDEGETLSMAIGCVSCADLATCGGLHKKQHAFSCLDDCCGKPETCDGMCPRDALGFLDRMREINGLQLENLPHTAPSPARTLPSYVPYLYHGNRRVNALQTSAVALPLRMFYRPDGTLKFTNRTAVEARFGLAPDTRFILIGSGRDKQIEGWWKLSERRSKVLAGLRTLGVSLITGPNYSMFTDEVRYNDMHSMKRIGITWQEIVASGVPGAYHLNARTSHDYRRLAAFIAARPEVTDVTFEFKTGAAWSTRLPFHVKELMQLAARVDRPLNLVMIGGMTVLPVLTRAFHRVTYVDTSAFMNTMHRQRLYLDNEGKMKKTSEFTFDEQPLDALLLENLATMRSRVEALSNRGP